METEMKSGISGAAFCSHLGSCWIDDWRVQCEKYVVGGGIYSRHKYGCLMPKIVSLCTCCYESK